MTRDEAVKAIRAIYGDNTLDDYADDILDAIGFDQMQESIKELDRITDAQAREHDHLMMQNGRVIQERDEARERITELEGRIDEDKQLRALLVVDREERWTIVHIENQRLAERIDELTRDLNLARTAGSVGQAIKWRDELDQARADVLRWRTAMQRYGNRQLPIGDENFTTLLADTERYEQYRKEETL